MSDTGGPGDYLNSSVVPLQNNNEHLAPGLIAAVTISSMFVFYFLLMMVVCLGEWYQYTHGKKGKSVFVSSNSSSTSNTRSQGRRSRHFSYTDGISSQSEPRVSSTVGQFEEDPSTEKPSNYSVNEIQETACIHETEEMVCVHKSAEESFVIKNDVEVTLEEIPHYKSEEQVHIEQDIYNDNCNSGIPGYLEISEDITLEMSGNDSVLPLLPKSQHSSDTFETDEDFLTESSESCYLQKAEASV